MGKERGNWGTKGGRAQPGRPENFAPADGASVIKGTRGVVKKGGGGFLYRGSEGQGLICFYVNNLGENSVRGTQYRSSSEGPQRKGRKSASKTRDAKNCTYYYYTHSCVSEAILRGRTIAVAKLSEKNFVVLHQRERAENVLLGVKRGTTPRVGSRHRKGVVWLLTRRVSAKKPAERLSRTSWLPSLVKKHTM